MPGRVRWAVLALGIAMTCYGVVDGYQPLSAYQVHFSDPGNGCHSDVLYIDAETGRPLGCAGPGTQGASPFTSEEQEQVFTLAEELGSDADGLSAADRQQVEALVRTIAAAHGDHRPAETKSRAGSPGHILFLLGVLMMLGGGIAVIAGWIFRP